VHRVEENCAADSVHLAAEVIGGITSSEAQYQGSGTVNCSGGYGFCIITVTNAPDTFRIRIWKKSTGEVVYDDLTGSRAYGIIFGDS
jgi:hypothetical protein